MFTPYLIAGCLLAGQPSGGEALKPETFKTDVARLVRQLDADKAKERQEAQDRLIQLGPAVLALLPAPESLLPNEELAKRVREIREQLQKNQASKSIESSTVTLHGRMKVSKVFAEIQKQTGNTITDLPRAAGAVIPDPEIVVDCEKMPFWAALDVVLDQAQLSVYPYGQPGSLQVVPRRPHDLPRTGRTDLAGPLRIEPASVLAKRDLRSSSPPTLLVLLEVAWEPRLRPIALTQRMADLVVLDSSGGSLAVDDPLAEKEPLLRMGNSAMEMEIALAMPAQAIKEIASLKGNLRMILQGKAETFRFADLLKGKQEKRIAAAKVTLEDVRKNGDSWEVFVRLSYDNAGNALESHRNWVLENEAYLEDAEGKPILPDSIETTVRTKNEVGVGYVFAMAELPKKGAFVYKTAGLVITKDFPYKVQGIKMP